jgi:L-asparaginase
MKTRIYVLYTGGTIGMAPKNPHDPYSPLEPQPLANLLHFLPDSITTNNASSETTVLTLENDNHIEFDWASLKPVDSADMGPHHWLEIANNLAAVYDEYAGFVVLHGTDTMAYTSSALSFLLTNLAKPVVITGSQLPISAAHTDATLNFNHALRIAGYQASGLALIPEVMVVFADKILRGCRATKVSSTQLAAFDSPNYPPLGTLGEQITLNTSAILPVPVNKRFFVHQTLETNVCYLDVFPGLPESPLRQICLHEDNKGIVLRTYGSGNVPNNAEFLRLIEQSVQGDASASLQEKVQPNLLAEGRLIVNISQCTHGSVEMGLYESSSHLLDSGVLSGSDMTSEAALTKLMWTLGSEQGADKKQQMQINQRGEQTESVFDLYYGAVAETNPVNNFTASVSPDKRLDRTRISRIMLRLSNLGVTGVTTGTPVSIQILMNNANHQTDLPQQSCIATLSFIHKVTKPTQTRLKTIPHKIQNLIDNGNISLTLVTKAPNIKLFFKGLYLAIYAKA